MPADERRKLWCAVSPAEYPIVEQLRQREGCQSIADLILLALNNLLEESGEDVLLRYRVRQRRPPRAGQSLGAPPGLGAPSE